MDDSAASTERSREAVSASATVRRREGARAALNAFEFGQILEQDSIYMPSIRTSFMRPDAPLLIETCALEQAKCFATRATSYWLALPSTGGDLSWASHIVPSLGSSSALTRALGLTFT